MSKSYLGNKKIWTNNFVRVQYHVFRWLKGLHGNHCTLIQCITPSQHLANLSLRYRQNRFHDIRSYLIGVRWFGINNSQQLDNGHCSASSIESSWGTPLLTWFNCNPHFHKQAHALYTGVWIYLSIPNFNCEAWEWKSHFISLSVV